MQSRRIARRTILDVGRGCSKTLLGQESPISREESITPRLQAVRLQDYWLHVRNGRELPHRHLGFLQLQPVDFSAWPIAHSDLSQKICTPLQEPHRGNAPDDQPVLKGSPSVSKTVVSWDIRI
jgi:hypothetical protein